MNEPIPALEVRMRAVEAVTRISKGSMTTAELLSEAQVVFNWVWLHEHPITPEPPQLI